MCSESQFPHKTLNLLLETWLMQSTFPFPGEAVFLACQWGTGNEKLKALSFVSFEKVLVSWETRRNNGFGWGFGTWLNQHHPQDISLQEQKLTLLVLQQQHCNRSHLSLFSILCQRYSQGSPLAKVLTLTLADNLLPCSDDMSFACTLLRTNPASTKLGRRWHNLSKKKVRIRKRRILLSPNYQFSFYIQRTNKAFELFIQD